MGRLGWRFEFVAGPFDGYCIEQVPTDEVNPDAAPPAELLIWEEGGRMRVRTPDQDDIPEEAERYGLLEVDDPAVIATYQYGDLAIGVDALELAAAA